MTRLIRGEAGYSIVEMLVVMAIMGIVMSGITTVFVAGSKAEVDMNGRFRAQLHTRLALDKLRRDIHCAQDVTPTTGYPRSSTTFVMPSGCGSNVSWCALPVSGYSNRYALYRQLNGTCSSSSIKVADYLVSANVFTSFTHTTGCICLASAGVDLKVSMKGSTTIGAYELKDTIYLRNSTRI